MPHSSAWKTMVNRALTLERRDYPSIILISSNILTAPLFGMVNFPGGFQGKAPGRVGG
jgi:hypothetical protein